MTGLKSTPRQNNETSTSYNVVKLLTNERDVQTDKLKEVEWRLDPTRFSKWYKVKPKGALEIGLSLVRVRSWVQRFVSNCRKPENQKVFGELMPAELLSAEREIIREAQNEAFSGEIEALRKNQTLPSAKICVAPQHSNPYQQDSTFEYQAATLR